MATVVFACSASREYMRNRVLVRVLRRGHRVEVLGSTARTYPRRLGVVVPRLLTTWTRADVYLAGFLGQPLVPFMRARRERPIILDAFVSVYDTLVLDRSEHSPRSPVGRLARWLDALSLRWADRALTDTAAAADFMAAEFGVARSKFVPVPVGADESLFTPRGPGNGKGNIDVLYYSTYLPLHGATVVVEAARLLREREGVRFTLVGEGPERPRAEALARKHGLENCVFLDAVPLRDLPEQIAACDIFLGGHFSTGNAKARRVVPGKVYQGLAMARPVVLGDGEANRQCFRHAENAMMVTMGDPESLAQAIEEMAESPELRQRLAHEGYELYRQSFSEEALTEPLETAISQAMAAR